MLINASDLIGTSATQGSVGASLLKKVYETHPVDTVAKIDRAIEYYTNALAEAVLARGGIVRRNPTWDSDHSDTLLDAMKINIARGVENFKN